MPFFKKNNSTKTYTRVMCNLLFGMVTIALLIITMLVTIVTVASSRKETKNNLITKVSNFSKDVDNWYLNNIQILHATAGTLSTSTVIDNDQLSLSLKNIINDTQYRSLIHACIAFDDDSFVTTSSNPYKAGEINLSKQNWFVNAVKNNGTAVVSLPEVSHDTLSSEEAYVTFSRSLKIADKQCVLMFKVSTQGLVDITKTYTSSRNDYVFLVDNTGRFITHPTEHEHFDLSIFSDFGSSFQNISKVFNGDNKNLLFTTKDYDGNKKLTYCSNNFTDSKLTSVGVGKPYSFSKLSVIAIIICVITFIFLSLLIYTVVAKKISKYFKPLLFMSNELERVSVGDFSINFDPSFNITELKTLAHALNTTSSSLKSYMNDAKNILRSLSECNLNLDISNDYLYDFIELQNSLSSVTKTLHDTFADINETSLAISYNAEHIQASSEELSENADTEMSYVKEITNCIDRLCLNNKVLNCKCVGTNELSEKLNELFNKEQETIKSMSISLSDIKEYYKNIIQATNTLSELSAQTDLLALKASIEASRMGESGKSFSKIATEIGSLAKDCTNAVTHISTFADGLTSSVNTSVEFSNKISKQVSEILSYFSQSSNIIDDISETINKQSDDQAQISSDITQISTIIENNKAASKENFSISDEASNQAILLKKIVDKFNYSN